jgi:hypothetical protein
VADALSRLDINEEPLEDSTTTFLGLLDCFSKTKQTKEIEDFQPLNYLQLQKAQKYDKSMMKLLKDDNTAYALKEFHGGGRTISLVTYRDKILIPPRLQKHVIMWYHTTLCHPGKNRTEETIGQHL